MFFLSKGPILFGMLCLQFMRVGAPIFDDESHLWVAAHAVRGRESWQTEFSVLIKTVILPEIWNEKFN